jgi:hypothetical protein
MKNKYGKTLLIAAGAALLCATTWLIAPSETAAYVTVKGQDVADKKCERVEANGSSTFGKCGSVCKDKEVTRDVPNNRYVCKAARTRPSDDVRPPKDGGVLHKDQNPEPKSSRPGKGKVVRIRH